MDLNKMQQHSKWIARGNRAPISAPVEKWPLKTAVSALSLSLIDVLIYGWPLFSIFICAAGLLFLFGALITTSRNFFVTTQAAWHKKKCSLSFLEAKLYDGSVDKFL